MARKKALSLRCPTCKSIVLRSDEHFPFCSERCRLIDLGKWASGGYRISSPVLDPELLEEIDQFPQSRPDEDEHKRR
ncbi:MAG: DNA gyrase inhibitor YacG [Acidobacteria bacterium]|nr:MAG: DNA gyrase inhibitor YacG [Acidobacteriota bacterium]